MSSATTSPASRGTAVVTGAAAGLGRAFAEGLARAGHDLALLDVNEPDATAQQARDAGRSVVTHCGDASDPDVVASFAAKVRASDLAPVRVVVNNVGISPYTTFDNTDLALWHKVMRVNLDSMYLVTHEFLPELISHGHGRVVNLTSTVVWDALARDMVAYATSKAAVVGFTRALAGEIGTHGVTVNCIAPGIVLTPDIRERVPAERLETYRNRQAIPRLAEPEDLVSTLLWLVDEASGMVTATTAPVNGGRVLL